MNTSFLLASARTLNDLPSELTAKATERAAAWCVPEYESRLQSISSPPDASPTRSHVSTRIEPWSELIGAQSLERHEDQQHEASDLRLMPIKLSDAKEARTNGFEVDDHRSAVQGFYLGV